MKKLLVKTAAIAVCVVIVSGAVGALLALYGPTAIKIEQPQTTNPVAEVEISVGFEVKP